MPFYWVYQPMILSKRTMHWMVHLKPLIQYFLIAFTVELWIQFIVHGYGLLLDGWLAFDTIIIVMSWAFAHMHFVRAFRALRALRLVTRVKSLKVIVGGKCCIYKDMLSSIWPSCFLALSLSPLYQLSLIPFPVLWRFLYCSLSFTICKYSFSYAVEMKSQFLLRMCDQFVVISRWSFVSLPLSSLNLHNTVSLLCSRNSIKTRTKTR